MYTFPPSAPIVLGDMDSVDDGGDDVDNVVGTGEIYPSELSKPNEASAWDDGLTLEVGRVTDEQRRVDDDDDDEFSVNLAFTVAGLHGRPLPPRLLL